MSLLFVCPSYRGARPFDLAHNGGGGDSWKWIRGRTGPEPTEWRPLGARCPPTWPLPPEVADANKADWMTNGFRRISERGRTREAKQIETPIAHNRAEQSAACRLCAGRRLRAIWLSPLSARPAPEIGRRDESAPSGALGSPHARQSARQLGPPPIRRRPSARSGESSRRDTPSHSAHTHSTGHLFAPLAVNEAIKATRHTGHNHRCRAD
jgi:hypothetical protein